MKPGLSLLEFLLPAARAPPSRGGSRKAALGKQEVQSLPTVPDFRLRKRFERREKVDDCGKLNSLIKYFLRRVSSLRLCVSKGHALPCARAAALGSAAGAPEQPFMNEAPEGGGGDFSYNNSLLLGFIHSLQSQCN